MGCRYIAAGFRQDMETLFNRFCTSEPPEDTQPVSSATDGRNGVKTETEVTAEPVLSLRFTRFCEIWRDMSFSFIFKFRQNDNEMREFVDEMYLEVLPNVAEDHRLERRVCALYLLYSLYSKQPKLDGQMAAPQKIRINFAYLQQMRDLIETCKQLDQLDVCYVWYKLVSMGAIHFVHVSRLMGPLFIRNSRVTNETQTKTDFLIDQFQTSLMAPLDELSHIHEKYRAMKEAIVDESPQLEPQFKLVDHINDNEFELTKAKMYNLAKEFSNTTVKTSTNTAANDETEECDELNDKTYDAIGEKRRKLKEKAFGFGNASNNTTETTAQTTDADNKPKKKSTTIAGKKRGRPKVARITDQL
ncbi:unnamed protein product [Medioppia subpectinata]|uniref:snRNA-activating protein complex subunit 1 n=1 Tax=Medioppia subpectinata TaxID=1979941 RepID=A0A7R9L424_9ACAR|nr:unnamed protein product [Medioppia subpectinata]CAG2114923.1 unnamed protein product [Medioppia subpectinata]